MSKIHDMGGRFYEQCLERQDDEPVFAQEWHARALALTLAAGALGLWNLDVSRHKREGLLPRDYMRFSYYEKWLAGLTDLLVQKGVLTQEELRSGQATEDTLEDLVTRKLTVSQVEGVLARGNPVARPHERPPAFDPGARVFVVPAHRRAWSAARHTRTPAYIQGHVGTIINWHGAHVFPDENAHDGGEAPKHLYTVRFSATQLWGHGAYDGDAVNLELWEPYLERAQSDG